MGLEFGDYMGVYNNSIGFLDISQYGESNGKENGKAWDEKIEVQGWANMSRNISIMGAYNYRLLPVVAWAFPYLAAWCLLGLSLYFCSTVYPKP